MTTPLKIIVGAGHTRQPGWVSLKQSYLDITKPKHWAYLFRPGSIDAVMAEHVFEHLSEDDGLSAFEMIFQYLKPRGYFRCAVPDRNHPSISYRRWCAPEIGHNGTDHREFYTLESLQTLLAKAGFFVQPLEFYSERGNLSSEPVEWERGRIRRSVRDPYTLVLSACVPCSPRYSSLICDAIKPS